MNYTLSRFTEIARDKVYRIYMTDLLKSFMGAEIRYYDLIRITPQETRTPEEIKQNIFEKLERMKDGFVQYSGETDT